MSGKILDRRFKVYSYILKKRQTTYRELVDEFKVSRTTIVDDVHFLSETFGAIDIIPGSQGGIKVFEHARVHSMVRLCEDDANALFFLYEAIRDEDYEVLSNDRDGLLDALESVMSICVLPKKYREMFEKSPHR